ncbi:hypothetical protein ES704_01983 [subsurface metagenome]|jgi:hypothetical protein
MNSKLRVFIASAIDEDTTAGEGVRQRLKPLLEELGFEVLGAGIGDNPIIPTDSPRGTCKAIIRQDLIEQSSANITLVVTDARTFAIGTWIEMWEGYRQGQFVIVLAEGEAYPKSIFLKGLADIVVHTEAELISILRDLIPKGGENG